MSAEEVEEYRKTYGSTANLFLHGETKARRIKSVKAHVGRPKRIDGKYARSQSSSPL